jgi:hypothetical protein
MKTIQIKNRYGIRNNPDMLTNLSAAKRWAANCSKLHLVILGDNGYYWVVCFSDAQILTKAGLEVAA